MADTAAGILPANLGPIELPPGFPPLAEVAGTLFLGYMLNWGLYGVLGAQVYLYYLAFTDEPLSRRLLVYGVFLLESIQVFMLTDSGFKTFGYGFGSVLALDSIGTIWFSVPLMSALIAWIVQSFYAYRILKLTSSKLPAISILFFSTVGLAGGIATAVIGERKKLFHLFVGHNMTLTTGIWNASHALCDVIIAGYMVFHLSRLNTEWKATKDTANRLIRLVVETGTLTATLAIINAVLSGLPKHPTYFQVSSAILGKLYSNSMLVMLNSRIKIGRIGNNDTAVHTSNLLQQHGNQGVAVRAYRIQEEALTRAMDEPESGFQKPLEPNRKLPGSVEVMMKQEQSVV
ncbi:hypothetical protein CPB83DRAFT_852888 [Crepidotus variabilis]|uniref:DUF6534 domain-containing protein n=1 Tax=Crepidotus variabilis TaxID=179855 RepID=A0A9P6EID5_9AGAR|nr:hypothetical protein CPB83DRAFT_852888 [Crepidotus variabilis]